MKDVSLYDEIFSEVDGELNDLKDKDLDNTELDTPSLKFESDIPKLERMCYIMEQVLLKKESDAVVYAGFQKISRAEAIWDRYLEIADNVKKIYLFGQKDKELKSHPNIEFVYLPEKHTLIREWFLVIDRPLAKSMMVGYDLDGFGVYENEKDRNFKGAKTTNPNIVDKATNLLQSVI